jgi:hypothetical protein
MPQQHSTSPEQEDRSMPRPSSAHPSPSCVFRLPTARSYAPPARRPRTTLLGFTCLDIGPDQGLVEDLAQMFEHLRSGAVAAARAIARRLTLALERHSVEQQAPDEFAIKLALLAIEIDGLSHRMIHEPPDVNELPPFESGLVRLLQRVRCRSAQFAAGWRAWPSALGGWQPRAGGWKSLMPTWTPRTGLAPPVVPHVIQRQ